MYFALFALLTGVFVLSVLWIVITGLVARSRLNGVRDDLPDLRSALASGNVQKADQLSDDIADRARSAHALTSGPAWWVGAHLPVVGSPLRTGRVISLQADHVGREVLPGVVTIARSVIGPTAFSNSSVNLKPIAAAQPKLHRASVTAREALASIDRASPSWLPLVSSGRSSAVRQFRKLDGELAGADNAVRVAVPMLGETGRKRYFIGFMNEAESRGLGGLVGAFAVVTVDHGRIAFEQFGSDDDLRGVRADVDLGADYQRLYAQDDPTGTFQNSDVSPNFPDAARIWAGMWAKHTGERIDGAIALDPTTLSHVLRITGPAHLSNGTVISADNIVTISQQQQYRRFPGISQRANAERKNYLIGIARAVASKLTSGAAHAQGLVRELSRSAGERRLMVWSADPTTERLISAAGWGGTLGAPAGTPYTGFAVTNAVGGKLDYYLERHMTYRRTSCAAGATSTATLRLVNGAPASGLPPYVTLRLDHPPATAKPGDNRVLVTYYASSGARVTSVSLNGRTVAAAAGVEAGLPTTTFEVELPIGVAQTVRITATEPKAGKPVAVLRQPLARAVSVDVHEPACG